MLQYYRNISYFFIILFSIVLLGFFKTYFSKAPSFDKVDPLVHWHFAFSLLWWILLFIQPKLIFNKRVDLHRILGYLSIIFTIGFVLTTFLMGKLQYQKSIHQKICNVDYELTQTFGDCIFFILFFVLAFLYRKKSNNILLI